ncbi:aldose 1-epimerase family protein [Propioniciclava coleopterorum]|uniref:Aldose 1-epimerase family protein n=1 Tax=Propioniciclava coleopterorum TaxID=2714937 RepID=A0A6G7Y7U3_9ACTN|nr:aldose 1-epimerase family protein [Propioniciclava coleopterorum]QIK72718.1 aldose 1-epimerase family protein [Propioniciclava coleopterorum]
MTVNGTLHHIADGDYSATVATGGATLVALTRGGEDLIATFDAEAEVGVGYKGRVLAPWPNRIADGRYTWAGVEYQLGVNEPATGTALHGLALWMPWEVVRHDGTAITLSLAMPGSLGYPFPLELEITYAVDAETGLAVRFIARNAGNVAAPVGLSLHPYLTLGDRPVDAFTLALEAERYLAVDDRLLPTGLVDVAGTPLDFRGGAPLDGVFVDHAYAAPAGDWEAVLRGPDGAVGVASDAPWVQVHTADAMGRICLAVEPMTCPPDAFNGPADAVALAPGAVRELTFGIRALD